MVAYSFPLSEGVDAADQSPVGLGLPESLRVMHAGVTVATARLREDSYVCEMPDDYSERLGTGKLEAVFAFEPPVTPDDSLEDQERELVSILLVGHTRH